MVLFSFIDNLLKLLQSRRILVFSFILLSKFVIFLDRVHIVVSPAYIMMQPSFRTINIISMNHVEQGVLNNYLVHTNMCQFSAWKTLVGANEVLSFKQIRLNKIKNNSSYSIIEHRWSKQSTMVDIKYYFNSLVH